jgi:hypothetical protein
MRLRLLLGGGEAQSLLSGFLLQQLPTPGSAAIAVSLGSGFILSVMEEISVAGARGCAVEARTTDSRTSVRFFLSSGLRDR